MPPRVSIVMLTFNRPQYIDRAIESVIRQTIRDWELIVVHDGPHAAAETILRNWEAREPRVRYYRRTEWGNIAEATNFAIRHSHGRYLAILDDDDYWRAADKLERQVCFLEENPGYVACGGGAVCIGQDSRELLSYVKPEQDADIKARALLANPMIHSTTLYRRDAAEKVGCYDESLPGFQDWDFFLKLGQIGKLYNFPDYFLCYQIWEGGGSFAAQRRNTESALRIVRRHGTHYRGRLIALTMATLYHAYSYFPEPIRRSTFFWLTRLKKKMFSQ
jgi:glycosyltransferase involved in cell wall biosynthesis